ncbi:MAG: hypothetical protein J0L87_08550 [Bacteroidetes bacterium]|nr:hypothetical protein [Bacteroidota bacterium]
MKKLIISIGFIIEAVAGLAQNGIAVKVDDLTVAQHKVLQSELRDSKILYSCIPAGIIVFQESSNLPELKKQVNSALKKAEILVEPKFIENYSIASAEQECATYRKID